MVIFTLENLIGCYSLAWLENSLKCSFDKVDVLKLNSKFVLLKVVWCWDALAYESHIVLGFKGGNQV